jgi:hypothetical protein
MPAVAALFKEPGAKPPQSIDAGSRVSLALFLRLCDGRSCPIGVRSDYFKRSVVSRKLTIA